MKKTFILFLLLITSSCTILTSLSGAVDPIILDPISGLLFGEDDNVSYIFFSTEQYVLIKNKSNPINSYYKLLQGEVYRDNIVTYKLDGWGSYHDQYIGLYIQKDATPQKTKLGITLQNSRALAINATKNLGASTSLITGTLLTQGPALYTLEVLSPVVKTSAAGIFKPDLNTFLSVKDLTPEGNTHAVLVKSTKQDNGFIISQEHVLTYRQPEDNPLSDSAAIYQYNFDAKVYLIGIKFDFDFDSDFPRLQITERLVVDSSLIDPAIENLALELNSITAWEYGFFSFIRVLDNSLDPFKHIQFIQFIEGLNSRYDPLNTFRVFINGKEDSIRISTTVDNVFTEEDYLIGPTTQSGVFKLLDFRNDGVQTYSDKFFTITSEGNIDDKNNISTIKIANTIDGFDNVDNIIKTSSLKKITDIAMQPLDLSRCTVSTSPTLGYKPINGNIAPTGGDPIAGRSGFQAHVESDTDTIHLVGGYTNSGLFPSNIPQRKKNTSFLQNIYNTVFTLDGVLEGDNLTTINTGLILDVHLNRSRLAFQQMIGATTKKTQTRPNDIFWVYGAGANNATGILNNFAYNNTTVRNWTTLILGDQNFTGKYHSAMVAHNNSLYIMGGTYSSKSIEETTNPKDYGEIRNEIFISSTLNTVDGSTWRPLTPTTVWTPRIHSRVFSVGKTLVLVGGMINGGAALAPTPINDVWISDDNGTNWNMINTGTLSSTAPKDSVTPPIQDTSEDGPLIGTVHGGIIYLLDPLTRSIYYSANKGEDWYRQVRTDGPLYGAQLVAIKDQLILIGGQKVTTVTADTTEGTVENVNHLINYNMENRIQRFKIDREG